MKRSTAPAMLIGVVAALFLLVGCSSDRRTVTLWTDHPDAAALVEVFNAQQNRYRVAVTYTDTVANDLATEQRQPDLVLARGLANASTFPLLRSLNRVYTEEVASQLYSDLSALGRNEQGQLLVPVSFDLPAIMFRSGSSEEELPDFSFTLAELREWGARYNQPDGEGFTRIGFSPRWSRDFLYLAARIGGARFRESGVRELQWNTNGLDATVELLRGWSEETNGGLSAESSFTEQYLYDPAYQLLQRGRVRFWYTSASDYFAYSDGQRNSLGFRWLSGMGRVPVLETIRFLGIPREASNTAGARAFLRWWLSAETQGELLRAARRKSVLSFGLLGGFTAFPRVNEEVVPRLYSSLLGKVPAAPDLTFPERKPKDWDDLRDDVVEQWLYREVSGSPHEGTLDALIEEWIRQRGE